MLCAAMQPAFGFYCSEPTNPNCPVLGSFSDDLDFQMCKSRMERYKRDVSEFMNCADRQKQDAIETYNKAVEKFNCAAQGGNCY